MVFNTGAALLDAIVLAVVSQEPEGTYGYKITQEVRQVIDLSESTLYPVLRRLLKDECLEVYDMECGGRNRRYYKVTGRGWAQLGLYESEWLRYSEKITGLFRGTKKEEAGDIIGQPEEIASDGPGIQTAAEDSIREISEAAPDQGKQEEAVTIEEHSEDLLHNETILQ